MSHGSTRGPTTPVGRRRKRPRRGRNGEAPGRTAQILAGLVVAGVVLVLGGVPLSSGADAEEEVPSAIVEVLERSAPPPPLAPLPAEDAGPEAGDPAAAAPPEFQDPARR